MIVKVVGKRKPAKSKPSPPPAAPRLTVEQLGAMNQLGGRPAPKITLPKLRFLEREEAEE
jgi:hypothetical protein